MALLLVAGGELGFARGATAQARDDDQPAAAPSGEPPAAGEPAPAADPPATDAAPIAPGSGKGFHAVVPARLLDSRTANGGWTGALSAGTNQDLVVTNRGGVPASASAVVMNVTATAASAGSFVTVYPAGTAKPNASNLNFGPNQTIPNLVTVRVGTAGKVTFANEVGATHVVADVVGYFDDGTGAGDSFYGVGPARILDTRTPVGGFGGPLGAGVAKAKDLAVRGQGGVPDSATAVVMNVTATNATVGSFVQVWPTGAARPNSSSLNFAPNQTIPNLVVVQIGAGGKVSFYNEVGSTDVVADVVAYFDPAVGSKFTPLATPSRVLDDRVQNGLTGPWQADQTRTLPIVGRAAIPQGATGVVMNTTATNGSAGSFVTVFPSGSALPNASNLNFGPGQTIPNLVVAQLPPNGALDIYNKVGTVDIVGDAVGYFAPPTGDVIPPDPASVAPPLDPETVTDLPSSTAFLYTGPNPVQTLVTPGAIDPANATVVRGRVLDRAGSPISGVRVFAPDHPELGRTASRADGAFDFVVNGGTGVVLQFQKSGFLELQRHAPNAAGEIVTIDDIVLIPLDSASTVVTSNNPAVQVARGSSVVDADGTRRNTVLFPAGTTAQMRMLDGSLQAIPSMTVRATEYTVGDRGPKALPGELPANSGYTYAVELSVDEARAAGATGVEFSQPLYDYVENFVGFPAGMTVPAATYDRDAAAWTSLPNGVVVQVVSITAGQVNLDVTGDGVFDTGTALTALGITAAERTKLATIYTAGTSLLRVPITHFSPFDFNWPGRCAECTSPEEQGVDDPTTEDDAAMCTIAGSIIGCQGQTLGERIPITGTPYQLAYDSSSQAGFKPGADVKIPVTGAIVPPLDGIQVTVDVAGRHTFIPVTKAPNQTVSFHWDGLDAYGRPVVGSARAVVRVTYIYLGRYATPQVVQASFGSPGLTEIAPLVNRGNLLHLSSTTRVLDIAGARRPGAGVIGGWGIDRHHDWDRSESKLFLGDGTSRTVAPSTGAVASAGVAARSVAAEPSGSVVMASGAQITRRSAAGASTVLAGTGSYCLGSATPCDEGAVASQARLSPQEQIAVGPDGVVDFVDGIFCSLVNGNPQCNGAVVRQIGADGRIRTIAGNGGHCVFGTDCPDVVPATSTPVAPSRITIDRAGILWILDQGGIRTVDHTGIIRTQYGCGGDCFGVPRPLDGDRAFPARMDIIDIEAAPNGDLVVLEGGNAGTARRVLAIDPFGVVHVLAGSVDPCAVPECGERGPAAAFLFDSPLRLAVDTSGAIYVEQFESGPGRGPGMFLYRFVPGGTIERFAGRAGSCVTYQPGQCGDGGLALDGTFTFGEITAGPHGTVFWSQRDAQLQLRVLGPEPHTPDGLSVLPSDDGSQIYAFDESGQHRRTMDAVSGVTTTTFGYDAAGRLVTLADRDGNVTTIERAANGDPTGIVSPTGVRTGITLDGSAHLASVVGPTSTPGNNTVSTTMDPAGRLTAITFPGNATHTFQYDADGRLTQDATAVAGVTKLARSSLPGGARVTVTTADGLVSTYDTTIDAAGVRTSTVTDPAGAVTTSTVRPDGNRTTLHADGSTIALTFGSHPRWGLSVPVVQRSVEDLPGGLSRTTTFQRSFVGDPTDITKVQSETTTVSSNGHTTTSVYTAASRTLTVTSPQGQVQTATFDTEGHIVSFIRAAGITPVTSTYRADGFLVKRSQGARSATFEYDALGRLTATVDAAGRRSETTYDARNFVTSRSSADPAAPYTLANDNRGNITALTTPGGAGSPGSATYTLGYDLDDRLLTSSVPGAGTDTNTYSLDGMLTQVAKASGSSVGRTHDAGGRLTDEVMPGVTTHQSYVGTTGRVASATWTGAGSQTVNLSYQGGLVTGIEATGAANGAFSHTWSADQWLLSIDLAGGFSEALAYDNDGKLVSDGPFTIGRGGPGGSVSSVTDGTAQFGSGYDAFGSANDRSLTVGATTAFRQQLVRDDTGRITTSTVTTAAGAHTDAYTYDSAGRLASAKKDGAAPVVYQYDNHGNLTNPAAGAAAFNSIDQLTTAGGKTYTYDENGNLTGRGADTFTYDARGELLSATVGGTSVQYRYDAMNRRVARIQGGVTTEYLYGDPRDLLRLTASRTAGVLTNYFFDDAGRVYAFERGGQRYYVGADANGTPRVIRDASATTVKEIVLDAWGNPVSDSAPSFDVAVGFAGGVRDPLTGFVRYGMRDYDPATGRFVQPDPTGFAGGRNRYAYASDDPVDLVDRTGAKSLSLEYYEGFGGGVEVSWGGSSGVTFCVLVGVGAGASISVDTMSPNANPAGQGVVFAASVGDAVAQMGSTAEVYKPDCGQATAHVSMDAQVATLQGHLNVQNAGNGQITTGANITTGMSGGPTNSAGAQVRLAYKSCWHWGESPPMA